MRRSYKNNTIASSGEGNSYTLLRTEYRITDHKFTIIETTTCMGFEIFTSNRNSTTKMPQKNHQNPYIQSQDMVIKHDDAAAPIFPEGQLWHWKYGWFSVTPVSNSIGQV
jgi:hypothetical protein